MPAAERHDPTPFVTFLLAVAALPHDPCPHTPPRAIRSARQRQRFTAPGEPGWWTRQPLGLRIRPLTTDDPALLTAPEGHGWR